MLSARVGALDLAYIEHGSGDPVLLINGTGEPAATWLGLMGSLGDRFRCVAYDARDIGASTYVSEPYTPADLASDAAGLIEAIGLGACHVVGYSLGGATAMELALARPGLVRSLVLLSTWPASDPWFVAQMRNWQAIRQRFAGDEHGFLVALSPWMFSPATLADGSRVDAIFAAWESQPDQHPDGWHRQCEADIAHDAAARLGAIDVPALVIVGSDDICTPPRYAHALAEALPRAELVEIADGGHCALFERPDEVHAAVARFLASVA